MLYNILFVWLLITVALLIIKPRVGIASYIVYTIVVPTVLLNVGVRIGLNLINMLAFFSFYMDCNRKHIKIDWEPTKPFLLYFGVTFVLMFFQQGASLNYMFNEWLSNFLYYLLIPVILWNYMKNDSKYIDIYHYAIVICIVISVLYGLFLTYLGGGLNPYQFAMLKLYGDDIHNWEGYYSVDDGRLFGHLSSVFRHPMNYAFFLGASLIYLYYLKDEYSRFFTWTLILLTGVMCILCGVRSVIAGLAIAVAYYFFTCKNYKMMAAILVGALVGSFIIEQIPVLNSYLLSVSGSSDDVNGSSIEMRLSQLEGAIDEGAKSPLIGLGYNWTGYYQSMYGNHPVCLAFESLLFMIICNFGIAGFLIWYLMSKMHIEYNKVSISRELSVINSIFVFYVAYAFVTGDYGYMRYYLLFYIVLLGHNLKHS